MCVGGLTFSLGLLFAAGSSQKVVSDWFLWSKVVRVNFRAVGVPLPQLFEQAFSLCTTVPERAVQESITCQPDVGRSQVRGFP